MKHADLERELEFYKRECSEIGARAARLVEEHAQVHREANRYRSIVRLVREINRLGQTASSPSAICLSTLAIVAESAICDRAVLLRDERGSGRFVHRHSIGFAERARPSDIILAQPPAAFYTAGPSAREDRTEPAATLAACLGLPYLLWSYDKPSGYALLIGNRHESNISRPYEQADTQLVATALQVLLDALSRMEGTASGSSAMQSGGLPVRREAGVQESEIKEHIRAGGRVTNAVVVERAQKSGIEYAVYLSTSWYDGLGILKTYRNKADKTYKHLSLLVQFVRTECAYSGPIVIDPPGSAELEQSISVRLPDLSPSGVGEIPPRRARFAV